MKKILIFIDWYEPGYRAGGPIRSIKNIVDHLKGEADFYIVTTDTDYQTTTPYSDIESDKWNRIEPNVQVYYISSPQLSNKTIKHLLTLAAWDSIYLNGIYSWYFSILPLWLLRKSTVHKIIAPRGMLASGALGVKSRKKKFFLSLARVIGLYKKVVFHATHPGEAEQIKKHLIDESPTLIAANLPAKLDAMDWKRREKKSGEALVVSIARISPEKNTKFAIEALVSIPTTISVTFHLYGPINDQDYWEDCKKIIATLPSNSKVEYKGTLPNDQVSEILKNYHLMFLPSLGENFGHVILEALTAATPVIISDQTPWMDITEKNAGWALPLNNTHKYVEKILEVAKMDQEQYNHLSIHSHAYAKQVNSNTTLIDDYRLLFRL